MARMLDLRENIAKAQAGTAQLRRGFVEHAAQEYFAVLDPIACPAAVDFQAGEARAYAVLKQEILSPDAVAHVNSGSRLGESELALVALSFEAIAPPLRIPGATPLAEPKTVTLALAAAAGAVGGMFALAPLLRLAVEMQDLGLVVGAPLGAFVAVVIAYRLARIRFLTRLLPWIFVRPRAWRGAVRSEHQKIVRACLEQWVDWAVPMLAVLCVHRPGAAESQTDRDKALRRISQLIYTLHQTGLQTLPVVAHELIEEAKNSGFEGLEGPPAFLDEQRTAREILTWEPDLQTRYERFGDIAQGDQVMVERPAVVLGGQVVQRGLVRKVRERT